MLKNPYYSRFSMTTLLRFSGSSGMLYLFWAHFSFSIVLSSYCFLLWSICDRFFCLSFPWLHFQIDLTVHVFSLDLKCVRYDYVSFTEWLKAKAFRGQLGKLQGWEWSTMVKCLSGKHRLGFVLHHCYKKSMVFFKYKILRELTHANWRTVF